VCPKLKFADSRGEVPPVFSVLANKNKGSISYFLAIGDFEGYFVHESLNLGLKDWGLVKVKDCF
jgi:hypothetical protein